MHLRQEQGQSLLFLFPSPVCLSLQILAGMDVKKAPFGACFLPLLTLISPPVWGQLMSKGVYSFHFV